ncbi:MAG: hypothetical protein O7E56_10885, partial [SAR324 cluster bacterium]|nr:hypothetical protein [SAR324 cluster bacterium]
MASPKSQRIPTAILSADVAGYSHLTGADGESTIQTLTACRELFSSSIQKFRGREMSRIPHEIARRVGRPTSVAVVQWQVNLL